MNVADQRGGGPVPGQPFSVQRELLERDTELSAVRGLIDAAARGGRLLVIEGPPGIGKTSLIAEAKALGQRAGMRVLGARGSELEQPFSYGVTRQLFEPLLTSASAEERAELLDGAARLAGPLFDVERIAVELAADSSLATLHGLYWLAANACSLRPLLLAVDDLQWCDLPSLRWLAYLLPRMEELPVLAVVGLRPIERGEDQALVGQIASDPLATVVRPAPLTVEGSGRLVRETLSVDADDAFCSACQELTDGNPLLLRELLHTIADESLTPSELNVSRLRELAARAGSRTVSLRLARLSPEATMLASAVAVLGDDADPRQAAALAELDHQVASKMAVALARVEVLRPQAPFGFVHPLIRAAVYEALTPVEREHAHARAADLLADAGVEPERVAAHLLRSSPAADSQALATLREAARRASGRGASESAVAYLRRGLAEPPPQSERADVLLELGLAEVLVSGDAAIDHLQAAHALVSDPIRRGEIALRLGSQLFLLRGEAESDVVLAAALEELADADIELARMLEAALIRNGLSAPALYPGAVERLKPVRSQPVSTTMGEKLLLAMLVAHDAGAGAPASEVVPLARQALADGTLIGADPFGTAIVEPCRALAMADLDEALAVFDDAHAVAHRRGSPLTFSSVKAFRAQTLVWRGELAEAEADALEALAAGEEWGVSARVAGQAASFLADALMEQGKLDEAAAALARAERGPALAGTVRQLYFAESSARLRILRGELAGGVTELLEAGRYYESVGIRNPAFTLWRSSAALGLQQLGEREHASRLVAEELELARAWGAPRALGAALRAAGLIEGGERGLAKLGKAVEVLSDSPAKLEHAKGLTELGAALRRTGQRVLAREQLRRAVELATICGAAPLAARAETELLATGARPRRVALSGVESLTPSERRVAEMAAQGPTNREIAQALFVTQRTVEVHLTSVFRKLEISSRSQLASALGTTARS